MIENGKISDTKSEESIHRFVGVEGTPKTIHSYIKE